MIVWINRANISTFPGVVNLAHFRISPTFLLTGNRHRDKFSDLRDHRYTQTKVVSFGIQKMAEEKKVDLSSFDGISDRVARAKAKAEAMRAAKAGGGTEGGTPSSSGPASPAPTPVSQTPSAEASPVPEAPPQAQTESPPDEGSIDLSSLDAITDRVARAKAKAEAMRAAKAGGKKSPTPSAPKAATKPGREPSVSAEAMAAKKAQAKARAQPTPPQDAPPASGDGTTFCPGVTIRRDGKLARIISTKYENVLLVYQDRPDEKVMTKLYRLEVERQRGKLVFAPAGEFTAVLPHSVGRFGRGLAFLAAAGFTGGFFLAAGLLIGPLNLFPTILVGYILFAFAHHLTE